jgi:AcrR family transcriptional regulator
MNNIEKLKLAYIEFFLEHDKNPSIFALCKKAKIKEEEFYTVFNSIDALIQQVWADFVLTTIEKLEKDETYLNYSVREKLLAFYFTLLEELKANRSYILYVFQDKKPWDLKPSFLEKFKTAFLDFAQTLINEGKETSEIPDRALVSGQYDKLLWTQWQLIFGFWRKDNTLGFESTDAFVEKSVNFCFDLIGRNFLDTSFDFLKYAFQNR